MKSVIISILTIVYLLAYGHAFAADDTLTDAFQRGNTYIRYHLAPDALQSEDDTETTFTLTHRTIDTIDAYFECIPGMLPNESISGSRRFDVNLNPERLQRNQYVLPSTAASAALPPAIAFWNIGNLALSLGYDEVAATTALPELRQSQPDQRSLAGQLLFQLGESGFSFGASVLMHAAQMQGRTTTESSHNMASPLLSVNADVPAMMGYATSTAPGNQFLLHTEDELPHTSTTTSGTRNAMAGTVNVSGAINGVQVFTEVGFESEAGEHESEILTHDGTASNFYAVGGANYTVGQVTLGFEAGFENGEEVLEGSDSLGFEHDFFIENLLPPDVQRDEALTNDKVYASVSAKLSPTERMTVGGAFKYIQPLNGTLEPYGFEVDGAFYFSLTSYLKYLAKAGISTPYHAVEESQYTFINSLEVSF